MKRLYYLLALLILPTLAIAQTDMAKSPLQPDKGPIIDNISANNNNGQEPDKVAPKGAMSIYNGGQNFEDSDQQGAPQDGSTTSQTKGDEGSTRLAESQTPIEQIKYNMRFFPNPSVNELNVELGDVYEVKVSLLNVLGQEVFSKSGELDHVKIFVYDMPRGTYFLTIQYQGDVVVKRIELAN